MFISNTEPLQHPLFVNIRNNKFTQPAATSLSCLCIVTKSKLKISMGAFFKLLCIQIKLHQMICSSEPPNLHVNNAGICTRIRSIFIFTLRNNKNLKQSSIHSIAACKVNELVASFHFFFVCEAN